MPTNISYTLKQKENTRYYVPTNGKQVIDVVKDMSWTLTPPDSREQYNNRIPYIHLTEYQQSTGQLVASLIYFYRVFQRLNAPNSPGFLAGISQADNDPSEVYKLKYFGDETGFTYRLPYFGPQHTTRGNTFGSDENPFSSLLDLSKDAAAFPAFLLGKERKFSAFSTIGKTSALFSTIVAVTNQAIPGKIKFEYPQAWNDTTLESFSTTFDLFNTMDENHVSQNRRFCHLISYQNTPSRRNFAIVDPPVIYSLSVPGVINFPVCYVNSLNITNLGNTRMMYIDGIESLIPEAYRINITFQSLLLPTRNIMLAVEKGQTVTSVGNFDEFRRQGQDFLSKLGEETNQIQNSISDFLRNNNPVPQTPPTPPNYGPFNNISVINSMNNP
jgi:hypothetical protein